MQTCKKCQKSIPDRRIELGYKICVECSTESKWSGVQIVHHKTGNEIQIIKDPEVAAEFIEKTKRQGFGTMKGIKTATKTYADNQIPKIKKQKPTPINTYVITSKRLIESHYEDEKIGQAIMDVFDIKGIEAAKTLLELEFQSLKISPTCRKQILYLFEISLVNC